MGYIKFDDQVSITDVASALFPGECSFYSFPGAITTLTLILICIITIFSTVSLITYGNILGAIGVIASAVISSLLLMYTNVYLIKGCQAAKLIKENNNKLIKELQ